MKTIDIKEVANSLIGKVLWCVTTVKRSNGKVSSIDTEEYVIESVKEWLLKGKSVWVCCGKQRCYNQLFHLSQLARLAMGGKAMGFFHCGDGVTGDGSVVKSRYYIKNK